MAPVAEVTKLRSGKSKTSFLSNRAVLVVVAAVVDVDVVPAVGVVVVLVVRQLVTRDFRLRKKSNSGRTIFNLNKNVML